MAKAVLVMDMPPKSCGMCDFVKADSITMSCVGKMYCGVPWIGEDVTDYIECIPDFCPLRELPEKKGGDKWQDEISDSYNVGWNACIEEIIKEISKQGDNR